MSYDLVTLQQKYPALPAELAAQLVGNFSESFDGGTFTRLSVSGSRFTLKGAADEELDVKALSVIFLGEGTEDHFTYYKDAYAPGNEDVKPTAVWLRGSPAPAVVPRAVLETKAGERKAYSIRRRTVLCVCDETGVRLTPVVYDIGSMSIYGDDIKGGSGAMSYSNYRRWCAKFGVLPCQIVTQIVFDRTQSVPVTKFIPVLDDSGRPRLLDSGTQKMIYDLAVSQEVKDLCKVNLIGDEAAQAVPVSPQPVAPVAPVAPAPQVPSQPKPELNGNVMMTPKITAVENPVPVQPIPTAPAQQVVGEAQELVDSNAALDALLSAAGGM